MNVEAIVQQLREERDKLDTAIRALEGDGPGNSIRRRGRPPRTQNTRTPTRRRSMSPAARKRIAAAMKARWAAAKKSGKKRL